MSRQMCLTQWLGKISFLKQISAWVVYAPPSCSPKMDASETHRHTNTQSSPDLFHTFWNERRHRRPLSLSSRSFGLWTDFLADTQTHQLSILFSSLPVITKAAPLCAVTTLPPTYSSRQFIPQYKLCFCLRLLPSISLLSLRIVLRSISSEFAYTLGWLLQDAGRC